MYVIVHEDENEVRVRQVMGHYIPGLDLDLPNEFKREEFDQLVENGEISQIDPPTFFIVTTRDTYKIKAELKSAGAKWDSENKFWFFKEEPSKKLCRYKEVLVYPFTGKRI